MSVFLCLVHAQCPIYWHAAVVFAGAPSFLVSGPNRFITSWPTSAFNVTLSEISIAYSYRAKPRLSWLQVGTACPQSLLPLPPLLDHELHLEVETIGLLAWTFWASYLSSEAASAAGV